MKFIQLKRVLLVLIISIFTTLVNGRTDLVRQLIETNGLKCEVHKVITSDGYKLTLHRIPPPTNASKNGIQRRPFLLMHGFVASAGDYVITNYGHSMPSVLHEHGFDVWLGNARGTTHSKRHMEMDSTEKEFWDFSWHEIGTKDLPAFIDYISNVTNQQQVHYVGHSQGATVFFVLLSERPEYNERIATAALLSPVAYLSNLSSPPVRLMVQRMDDIRALLNHLGLHELFSTTALNQLGGHLFCSPGTSTQQICKLAMYWLVGFSDQDMVPEVFPTLFETTPAGISRRQLEHFGQLIKADKFQQFDFGPKANYQRYQQKKPPSYKLQNVHVPLQLFYGTRDALLATEDVIRMTRELPINTNYTMHELRGFNHIDLLFAREAPQRIFKQIALRAKRSYS